MRLREFKKACRKKGIGAVILSGRDGVTQFNIEYFTQCYPLSACTLIARMRGRDEFLVPRLELARMRKSAKVRVALLKKGWERKITARTIGYDAAYCTVSEFAAMRKRFPKSRFVDVHEMLTRLREIKTPQEIARMRKACAIGDSIMKTVVSKLPYLRTEMDVQRLIVDETARWGVAPSFPPIAAAGQNAAGPHHTPQHARLRGWCVIDMGVRYRGYCSDMTRTVFIGAPAKQDRQRYEMLLRAQETGIARTRAGTAAGDVDAAIRSVLGNEEKLFIHGTGHAVGLEIHDTGLGIRKEERGVLKEGMAVTVEPGLYATGKFGMRIEDTIIVRKGKADILTRFPKGLIVVKPRRK